MRPNKMTFFFVLISCLFVGHAAFSQVSSTSSEFTGSTSGSVKKLFSQNEKEKLNQFVDQNFDRLQEAAAKGSGPVLKDYVSLIGCQDSENRLTQAIQKNYSRLFESGKSQLLPRTQKLIESDFELAQACDTRS